jgi:hypothetical protein
MPQMGVRYSADDVCGRERESMAKLIGLRERIIVTLEEGVTARISHVDAELIEAAERLMSHDRATSTTAWVRMVLCGALPHERRDSTAQSCPGEVKAYWHPTACQRKIR